MEGRRGPDPPSTARTGASPTPSQNYNTVITRAPSSKSPVIHSFNTPYCDEVRI
ncbi:hypothetical protein HMPREF9005_1429 [Actinomyces sp. oral taxon 178 str. F0338]|nr:hypothetical protein HMPREF9005_1429 [Actinomyces sp. oral taxon 178 str. F0338]